MTDDNNNTKLTIHLTISAAPGAPRVPIEIASDVSGVALRQQAAETTKIPLSALKLIFRGRMIANDDKQVVSEYKLEEGSVLHCMGKPVQGNAAPAAQAAAAAPAPAAASLPSVNLIPPAAATAPATAASSTGDALSQALQTLRASNPPQAYKTAVETLDKLLAKIIENPMEAKYRRVKKENPAFTRKLGGLMGGEAAMKGAGFVVESDESGQPVYQMHASAEAWPKLMAAQTTIKNAVQEASAAGTPSVPPTLPGFPSMSGNDSNPMGAMSPGMPPAMQQAAATILSNPQAMQNMLQDPMIQNMMRNDPRFANNPMAQEMMQALAANPALLQQASQRMSDPAFMQRMQQLQQNPAVMQRMENMFGNNNSMPGGSTRAQPQQQQSSQQQASQPSDQDMTEEEMIAEAIRRSLQDNNNN